MDILINIKFCQSSFTACSIAWQHAEINIGIGVSNRKNGAKMFKKLIHNFILCGTIGWCLEILFTALQSLKRRNLTLAGNTSLWMFPIYGSAVLLKPFFFVFRKYRTLFRGVIYAAMIFAAEYLSGNFLKKHGLCPWDYRRCPFQIRGVIRLDFFPLWILTGLLFEKILTRPCTAKDRIS